MPNTRKQREGETSLEEGVDRALQIMNKWGLPLQGQAQALGLNGDVGTNPEYVAHQLKSRRAGTQVEERCAVLIDINSRLDAVFKKDPAAEKLWLKQKLEALGNRTPWSLVSSGSLADLRAVAGILQRITG